MNRLAAQRSLNKPPETRSSPRRSSATSPNADVLSGERGHYKCRDDGAVISVPATLQATIAARIDRLEPTAKHALYAAAVIGADFAGPAQRRAGRQHIRSALVGGADGGRTDRPGAVHPTPEYAFRHPLIRAVAYESQLKAGRAELHRRFAAAIEQRDPD